MNRSIFVVVALLVKLSVAATAEAADYSSHKVEVYSADRSEVPAREVCARRIVRQPYCPPTVVVERPRIEVVQPICPSPVVVSEASYVPKIVCRRLAPSCPTPAKKSCGDIPVGSTVTAKVNFLGTEKGHVMLDLNGSVFACRVTGWDSNEVTFTVPDMGLVREADAQLQILRPTGGIVKAYTVTLVSKPELYVQADTAVSPVAGRSLEEHVAETSGLVLDVQPTGTPEVQQVGF